MGILAHVCLTSVGDVPENLSRRHGQRCPCHDVAATSTPFAGTVSVSIVYLGENA